MPTKEQIESATSALIDASYETHRDEYSCIMQDRGQSLYDVGKILATAALEAVEQLPEGKARLTFRRGK